MSNIQKLVLVTIVAIVAGYYSWIAILKKNIQQKLGSPNASVKSDLDKLSLSELRHFNKLVESYLAVRDSGDASQAMPNLTKIKNLISDEKMKSIMSKTDNLKNFSMLGTDFISLIK